MENQTMTVEEVMRVTIGNLESITIPVTLSEGVGVTVNGCIRNLKLCLGAMERERAQQEAAAAAAAEQAEADAAPAGGEAWEEETDE